MSESIWFWQNINSPHVAGLAGALAARGVSVTYVANEEMTSDREALGWQVPKLDGCEYKLANDIASVARLVHSAPEDSVHICQGIRGNKLIGDAQILLTRRRLRQLVMMETVDDQQWYGLIKRIVYKHLFRRYLLQNNGILAIGHATSNWVISRGVPASHVYPFAYFLPELTEEPVYRHNPSARFRFIFVGQFIELKKLDMLIDALGEIHGHDFELVVIGLGPLENELRNQADRQLGERLIWLGKRMQPEVIDEMRKADCLVLPSRYDGWGAVVSEALMVGTPTIVSDQCGAAGAVKASGKGGVFKAGDMSDLLMKMNAILTEERHSAEQRHELAEWARCLGVEAGADYLKAIIEHHEKEGQWPSPPWLPDIPG